MRRRKIINRIVAGLILTCLVFSEFHISVSEVEARTVAEIEKEQKALSKEIDGIDKELYNVVSEIQAAEDRLGELELEIEDTKASLESANLAAADQYASMKIRIQYIYENGDKGIASALFEAGSLSDFLNRIEYATKVHTYDEDKMDMLESIVAEITELETALEKELSEVEATKLDYEAKKKNLDDTLAKKKKDMANLGTELEKAKEAARKAALLAAQKKAAEEKARLEAQKKAIAEAQEILRRQQEEAKKAEEEKNKPVAQTKPVETVPTTPTETTPAEPTKPGETTTPPEGTTPTESTTPPAPVETDMGALVVAYASQFIGNPYVWGGTSLTNGCDCSGFVTAVYNAFGFDFGGSRLTSASCRSIGRPVEYSDMRAGDIVCYSGHVGIYTGYGTIVEAQNARNGITNTRSVNCHTILAIRRLL